jgi:lysyl endopeptidase
MKRRTLLFALAFWFPAAAMAQRVGSYTPNQDAAAASAISAKIAAAAAEAPRIAERYGLPALSELGDAAVEARDRLEALRAWNEAHRLPLHNGFERPLPVPRRVELTAGLMVNPVTEHAGGLAIQTSFDKVAWGGMVRVANAYRLRLHLSQVSLPAGARLWVHGGGQTAGPFGSELIGPGGDLWTPSVGGPEAALDVELPAAALAGRARVGFTLDRVMELVEPGTVAAMAKDSSCDVDASCFSSSDFPAINTARHAVAMIFFVDSGSSGQCTAQLLNDSQSSGTPYLLTANHCISTPAGARSLDAFWDYFTPSCNGPQPDPNGLPRSFGATLLATASADTSSDFTLVRLNSIPAGRAFLGWDASPNATPAGTQLYRLSHPNGMAQTFNVTSSDSTVQTCPGFGRPTFLYSDQVKGATHVGSSGSAAILADGQVVGQLYGSCGSDNDCSPLQFTVDGAFSHSAPALQQFLQGGGGGGGVCRPDDFTICLLGRRFKLQVNWVNQFNGASGGGLAIPSTDTTGFFYFTDPSNYELIIKILDFGNVVKVFYGELTNLQFTITVTDTRTGTVKTYKNTPGDCGAIDANAFSADSASPDIAAAVPEAAGGTERGELGHFAGGGATSGELEGVAGGRSAAIGKRGSCQPGGGTLCLLNRRFALTVSWMNQFDGSSGHGSAGALSDQSGLFIFTDPSVIELVMKAVEFSDRVAFFYSALSNLEYDITVTDTVGGTTKTYHNPAGNYCGGLDNNAFPP